VIKLSGKFRQFEMEEKDDEDKEKSFRTNLYWLRNKKNVFIYPALLQFEHANCINWIDFGSYTVTDEYVAFLVLELCRATVRNVYCVYSPMIKSQKQQQIIWK
jgi:hypothetical protein